MAYASRARRRFCSFVVALALAGVPAFAQNPAGARAVPPPDGPVVLSSVEYPRIRVVSIAGGLSRLWDLFVTDSIDLGVSASRIAFGPDGLLYMGVGGAIRTTSTAQYAQDPLSHYGKVLRLRDDGTVPDTNPFVGNADYLPEIYSLGHRTRSSRTTRGATCQRATTHTR